MALCGTAANLSAWILAETPRRANPFVQALGEDRRPVEAVLNVFLRCKSAGGDGRRSSPPSIRQAWETTCIEAGSRHLRLASER